MAWIGFDLPLQKVASGWRPEAHRKFGLMNMTIATGRMRFNKHMAMQWQHLVDVRLFMRD